MPLPDFDRLRHDIAKNGVRQPIIIWQNKVLDGWHRYQAAMWEGVECPEEELAEGDDPVQLVISLNGHRRHFTKAQNSAAIIATLEVAGATITMQQLATIVGASAAYVGQVRKYVREGYGDALISGKTTLTKLRQKKTGLSKREEVERSHRETKRQTYVAQSQAVDLQRELRHVKTELKNALKTINILRQELTITRERNLQLTNRSQ